MAGETSESLSVLQILDRVVAPISTRLEQIAQQQREDTQALHAKLDKIAGVEIGHQDHARRLDALEVTEKETQVALAEAKGRNTVIIWVMTVIGGPIVVALVVAGVSAFFHIKIGG